MTKKNNDPKTKKDRALLKAIGSVLFAVIASSHHWLHTLLIALGLTTLGTGLFALPPTLRLVFLLVSLVLSVWFIIIAKRKWSRNRPAAWVYLISSLISIILVITAIPDTITNLNQPVQQEQEQEKDSNQEQQKQQEQPSQHDEHNHG